MLHDARERTLAIGENFAVLHTPFPIIDWSMDPYDDDEPREVALPEYRHRWWVDENHERLPCLYDAEGYPVIEFTPVPQQRRRRVGWDAERQRAFIRLLARVPSVGQAARAVGMSARSAYKLLDRPDAQEFARAWDQALEEGMTRLRGGSVARALLGGDHVPVYRKGRLVRIEFRRNDKLAIALLSGRGRDVDTYRRGAQVRWRQKREWAKCDSERAAEQAAEAEAEALFNERIAAAAEEIARRRQRVPRIRML